MSGDTADDWTTLQLCEVNGSSVPIKVSNPHFPVPQGLEIIPDFLSAAEATALLHDVDENQWYWEGFSQKRRVQRYSVANNGDLPKSFLPLLERLNVRTSRQPLFVAIEEYPSTTTMATHPSMSTTPVTSTTSPTNKIVTTFESLCLSEHSSDCFVAQVPLCMPAVQHLNCPEQRDPECWMLRAAHYWTDIWMEPRTLFIKSDECLRDWRSRILLPHDVIRHDDGRSMDRVVLVKFYTLPVATRPSEVMNNYETENATLRSDIMPPLREILTIIVTTSPIKSNPSTELLERTFDTFREAGPEFAYQCKKVIICDGCRLLDDDDIGNATNKGDDNRTSRRKVSRKHSNVKQALRNGIATSHQAENYQIFKESLRKLCMEASDDSPFYNSVVEELSTRHGYGFALRHALLHCVTTPYVCVIQHDRTFMRKTPIHDTVRAMWHQQHVKYVGMSMRSNLTYLDIFLSKYGKAAHDELSCLVLRLPELALDATCYGPMGSSTHDKVYTSDAVRKSIEALVQTYKGSSQCLEQEEWLKSHPAEVGKHQLSLTPTLFWYDNTHICETAHYRDFVFHPKYQMVARGGFVEDKLSPAIARSVERLGLQKGHARFGCYLLDDHSGMFFTGHLDGGSYLTDNDRKQFGSEKIGLQ